ncbi:hypothetical protein [Helicobacter sp. T3_23-1056]
MQGVKNAFLAFVWGVSLQAIYAGTPSSNITLNTTPHSINLAMQDNKESSTKNSISSVDSSQTHATNDSKHNARLDGDYPAQSIVSKSNKHFDSKANFALGIFGNFGSMMGGGLEVGFCLYCGEVWQLRNAISFETKGIKLRSTSYDTVALIAHEKLMLGATLGSSLASHIGLAFFRPYLHISGGFGVVDYGGFWRSPHYYEAQAGIGHEFISLKGNGVFFELGGGIAELSTKIPDRNEKSALGGIFKILLGVRFYF